MSVQSGEELLELADPSGRVRSIEPGDENDRSGTTRESVVLPLPHRSGPAPRGEGVPEGDTVEPGVAVRQHGVDKGL